jgi:hypothetical protein
LAPPERGVPLSDDKPPECPKHRCVVKGGLDGRPILKHRKVNAGRASGLRSARMAGDPGCIPVSQKRPKGLIVAGRVATLLAHADEAAEERVSHPFKVKVGVALYGCGLRRRTGSGTEGGKG